MLPIRREVDVAADAVREAGGPQQDRGVEDVGADDAVRREAEEEDQREADQRAGADRGEPEHEAEHERRCATAATFVRAVERDRVALARDGARHEQRAARAIDERDDQQRDRDDDQQRVVEPLP